MLVTAKLYFSRATASRPDADLDRPQADELLDDAADGAPQSLTEAAAVQVPACRVARLRRQVVRHVQLQSEHVDQLVLLHGPLSGGHARQPAFATVKMS